MRHTVRRLPRRLERGAAHGPLAPRTPGGTAPRATASRAALPRRTLTTTRIPHNVPETPPDSGP
ncbi:hypothetical protein DD630_14425 [Streptomyces sp. BSE7F]|nr:hypothetical protein DD630_14425 [Streptomyces sp. BSE7F]